jgi:hypothetical protein
MRTLNRSGYYGLLFAALCLGFVVLVRLSISTRGQQPSPPPATGQQSTEEAKQRDDWRVSMAEVPLPKQGCFQSSYPSREWQELTCTKAPPYPMPPRRGPVPLVVGNGDDISAQAPTGFISTAIGTFSSVTNVTSETGQINGTGPQVANSYSLQLNSNFFASTACSGAAVPAACQGWEQFIFANNGTSGFTFIQYWLTSYNTACPAGGGWTSYPYPGPTDISCYKNSMSTPVPNQVIDNTNLPLLSLSGTVTASSDSVTMGAGTTLYAVTGVNAVNAAAGWTIAEFNLVGNAGGGQANFNSGADIVPRTRIIYGNNAPPNCWARGFTGETNNLLFGPTAPVASAPGPAVRFRESTAGSTPANCAFAVTVGDTHLATFGGLFYDFQASGDFVLAQVDRDFEVQTRQVSGAPTWPDASVNSAVATQMGSHKVAICLPGRLNVDGANTELGDGRSFSTPDGVDIWRRGNDYFIIGQSGDSVRATINPSWIDVSVGLGHWPANVTGLLANAGGDVNKIAARDGTVLTNPFNFGDFYDRYGESWRVAPGESLLSVCGDRVERGNPGRTFYAKDLDRSVYARTRAVCVAAGVKEGPLLDACTLDVAVIGNDAAAKVFVGMHDPIAVGNIIGTSGGSGSGYRLWWLWLLILLLIILFILWLLRRRRTTP